MKKNWLIVIMMLSAVMARAQWPTHPDSALRVSGSYQLQTKTGYTAWLITNSTAPAQGDLSSYVYHIQLMNKAGYIMFPNGPVKIINYPTRNFSMYMQQHTICEDNTPIVMLCDSRNTIDRPGGDSNDRHSYESTFFYRYATTGEPMWDAYGIDPNNGEYFYLEREHSALPMSDGSVVIAWTSFKTSQATNNYVNIAMIKNGVIQKKIQLENGSRYPHLIKSGTGFILIYSMGTDFKMYAQKYNRLLDKSWGEDKLLVGGGLMASGSYPHNNWVIIPDDKDGCFVSFCAANGSNGGAEVRIARLTADGQSVFSTGDGTGFVPFFMKQYWESRRPVLTYDDVNDVLYMIAETNRIGQQNTTRGYTMSAMDGSYGGYYWADSGRSVPTSNIAISAATGKGGLLMAYAGKNTAGQNCIKVKLVDVNDEPVHDFEAMDIANGQSVSSIGLSKFHLNRWLISYGGKFAILNLDGKFGDYGPDLSPNKEEMDKMVSFGLFPNPTNGKLYMETNNNSIRKIQLMDMLGRVKMDMDKDAREFDMSGLSGGFYTLVVHSARGIETVKIIKN